MPTAAPPKRALRSAVLAALVLATVGCAVFAGWVDLHNDDVQASILIVAGASFAITVLFSRGGWLGGFLVGFGVPLAHWYAKAAHIPLPYSLPHASSSLEALIPAAGGMITGLALRAGIASMRK